MVANGTRVLAARKAILGLTQSELAARLGIEAMTVSRWERGVAEPTPKNLRALAEMAEKPVAWFYEEDGVAA